VSKYFECYYCKSNTFKTDNDFEYQNHVEQTSKLARLPVYPSRKYLVKNSLKKQDKYWEYLGIDN